ncbi:MAG: hypothetical protein JSS27_19935 [Planctomycetes bacterium]|nr:hypothetical protein [Planctomycetota bacterium]
MGVRKAIAAAEKKIHLEPKTTGKDPRWHAIIQVGEYIEKNPESVWRFISRWGGSKDDDLRTAIALCLLEHLLQYHFDTYFTKMKVRALEDRLFADVVMWCRYFGQSELPRNRNRLRRLVAQLAEKFDFRIPYQHELRHSRAGGNLVRRP